MDKKKRKIIVRDYFNPPMFDWFYRWKSLGIQPFDIYTRYSGEMPIKHLTEILWKSMKTGKIVKKSYNYQINGY